MFGAFGHLAATLLSLGFYELAGKGKTFFLIQENQQKNSAMKSVTTLLRTEPLS
jgi:hypothetical protein